MGNGVIVQLAVKHHIRHLQGIEHFGVFYLLSFGVIQFVLTLVW